VIPAYKRFEGEENGCVRELSGVVGLEVSRMGVDLHSGERIFPWAEGGGAKGEWGEALLRKWSVRLARYDGLSRLN